MKVSGSALFLNSSLNEVFIGAAFFGCACVSFWLTRAPNGIALLWPANAIAAALLIRLPKVRWGVALIALLFAGFCANMLVAHRPWGIAAALTGTNGIEIAMMVATFRFALRFPYPDLSIGQAAIMTGLFGIVIPGIAASVAGILLHDRFQTSFAQGTLHWWSSHAIGACLVGPPIILFSVKEFKRLIRGRYLAENALTVILVMTGCYLAIRYLRFPFISIGLLLLLASFRLGGFGTSLMSVAVGFLITNLWLLGIRPLGLDPSSSASASLAGLPVIAFLTTVMPPISVGLGSDARRAAIRALRASESRFRESMEYSPIGMLIADLSGVWGYTNIALQQMLGYSAEEFRRLPPGGPSSPEDWNESASRWNRLLSGEIAFYDVARRFRHKDGHWLWTHVAVSLLRDDEGRPLHLIAQIESLEARQRAEDKLAEERERLKITLGSINDAVVTTDAHTRITYLNAAAQSLLGLDLASVENRRVDEVIHFMDPQSSRAAENLIAQSALHGKVLTREQPCLLHRSDGTVRYVIDTVSPVLDTAGLVTGLVIVFRDATQEASRARDLLHRALHDPLTGLSNRDDFRQRLNAAFQKASHLNRPAALLAIDLDRFKAVNDAAGHATGDEVLCKVAEACRSAVRASDTVARLGGDEFAILLHNCSEERAHRIGRQLLQALNNLSVERDGNVYSVGASIGLAMYTRELSDETAWIEAADQACYRAKREGRGRLQDAAGLRQNSGVRRG